MINLIPKTEKKKMAKGLYYKLLILFLATGGLSFFIICVSILPSYFFSAERRNIANEKLEMQKKEPTPSLDQQTLLAIKDLNSKLSLVENAENNKFNFSEKVINAVVLKKTPDIEITGILYQNDKKNDSGRDKKISIQGNASSREVLLLFRKALEDSANFERVDLPISNFIMGSDIQFYLSLIPRSGNDSAGRALQHAK